MLDRLARTCYRRRGRVLLAWVVLLFAINILANGIIKADYNAKPQLPNGEAKQVQDELEKASPNRAGFTGQIVFKADQGVDDPAVQAGHAGFVRQGWSAAGRRRHEPVHDGRRAPDQHARADRASPRSK